MDITDEDIRRLVNTFYTRVRQEPVLGPIFERHVADWPSHLETMVRFWTTVATGKASYKGTPARAHMAIAELEAGQFALWLDCFTETTAALFPAAKAEHFNLRAGRIAESLKLAVNFRDKVLS